MLRQGTVAAILACAIGGPAFAQDAMDFMNGVYASSQEDCDNVAKGGLASLSEGGAILSADGMKAYEYSCDFTDVKALPNGKGWFADAVCEEPDETFPDIASIVPAGDSKSVKATFMTDWVLATTGQEDVGDDNTGDDNTGDDSNGGAGNGGGNNKTPPTVDQNAAKQKGSTGSSSGGSTAGSGDDQGGGDQGDDQAGNGDDQGGGSGDDQGGGATGPTTATATQFFFCPNVTKANLK